MSRLLLCLCLLLCLLAWVEAEPLPSLAQFEARSRITRLEPASAYLDSARRSRQCFLQQGGVVKLPGDVPTVILPDLHAQRDYLVAALKMPLQGSTVWQLLQKGQVNLLCLGDGMHGENRVQSRWLEAEQDYLAGRPSSALQAEMVESLGLLKMVMDLKLAFPRNFYFVRGNHEDIDPSVPYRKFTQVGESNLVKAWTSRHMGTQFLKEWHACEESLPLIAEGSSFVASHSPPGAQLTRQQAAERRPEAFRACTWSDNTRWSQGGAEEQAFLANCQAWRVTSERPWIAGHRKVEGALYRSQCEGRLIQINPLDYQDRVIALAPGKAGAFRATLAIRKLAR